MLRNESNESQGSNQPNLVIVEATARKRPSKRTMQSVGALVALSALFTVGAHANKDVHETVYGDDGSYTVDEHGDLHTNVLGVIDMPIHKVVDSVKESARVLQDAIEGSTISHYYGDDMTGEELGRLIEEIEPRHSEGNDFHDHPGIREQLGDSMRLVQEDRITDNDFNPHVGGKPLRDPRD